MPGRRQAIISTTAGILLIGHKDLYIMLLPFGQNALLQKKPQNIRTLHFWYMQRHMYLKHNFFRNQIFYLFFADSKYLNDTTHIY